MGLISLVQFFLYPAFILGIYCLKRSSDEEYIRHHKGTLQAGCEIPGVKI